MENIALNNARKEYSEIESRYVAALEEKGLKFARPNQGREEREALRKQLAERGVNVRNAGASLSYGHLSPACIGCTSNVGSETFSTTFKCHRDCYFCFNKNQPDYERLFREGCPWRERMEASYQENDGNLQCIGLTGGEPLLDIDDSIELLERSQTLFPSAHRRMYTSGDLLTEETARRLAHAGLDEIRFSVKPDDAEEQQLKVLAAMRIAKGIIPSVMVEMPIEPGTEEYMKWLLREFDSIGIDGINMLELCFPFNNWEEFEKRGFVLRNPPFEVMYDYGYSGGLAVAGSEELILKLMLWCIDEGLGLGLHYCSLENKHRSEIRIKNERIRAELPFFEFDEGDFFLKAAQVYGADIEPARKVLAALGCLDYREDDTCITFPLKHAALVAKAKREDGSPVDVQVCYFVYEIEEDTGFLIDVAVRDYKG